MVTESSAAGPRKRFREMTVAHVGGHSWGLPGLAPIRNSSELWGLCCRSCFGPRTCGRGITNYRNVSGLSIRVSPSHPYNADRAGLGWMSAYKCTLLAGMVLGIVFVTMLPDTVDDSSTSTRCLYFSPSQLCLIKRIRNFKRLWYILCYGLEALLNLSITSP